MPKTTATDMISSEPAISNLIFTEPDAISEIAAQIYNSTVSASNEMEFDYGVRSLNFGYDALLVLAIPLPVRPSRRGITRRGSSFTRSERQGSLPASFCRKGSRKSFQQT